LLLVAFLWSFAGAVAMNLARESWDQQRTILRETNEALAATQAANPRPRRLTPEDMAKAAPLSEATQHWLRNASITIAPAPERVKGGPGMYFPHSIWVPTSTLKNGAPYSAVVRAANGTQCSLLFETPGQGRPFRYVTAICQ
jgi:hypothetical protein